MTSINTFRQFAAQKTNADRVRLDGGTGLRANGRAKERLVQAFTPNKSLKAGNEKTMRAFVSALQTAYGQEAAKTAFDQHLSNIATHKQPLSSRVIQSAISTADAEARYTVAQHCANGETAKMAESLQRMHTTDPTQCAQFVNAKLGDAGTSNVNWTKYFVTCPGDPMAHGAANIGKLDVATLNGLNLRQIAGAADQYTNGAEHVSERFRQVPGLKLANGVWSANAGSGLNTVADNLNGLQNDILARRVGQPIANAVHNFCNQQHLDVKAENRLMAKVLDKLTAGDLLDFPTVSFHTEIANGKLGSLQQVAAEFMTPAQLDTFVGGLNYDQKVRLIADCFAGRVVAYSNFKEGSVNLMAALERHAGTPAEMKTLISNLRSEYFNAETFFQAVGGQVGIDIAKLGTITTDQTTAADLLATSLKNDFNTKATRATTILNHYLGQTPPGGTLSAEDFRAKTGLTITQAQNLIPMLANPASDAQAQKLLQTFGSGVQLPDIGDPAGQLNNATYTPPLKGLQGIAQLAWQLDGLNAGGQKYLDGLKNMSLVLPTAGKDLSQLTFLKSMADSLHNVISDSGVVGGNIQDYPLLVFDQSNGQRLIDNKTYIDQLALDTGARIERITMADVNTVATKLGITAMFDTTSNGRAGFGGARNIANLLGPVFDKAIKAQPGRTVADVVNMTPDQLKQLLRTTALTNNQMVLMGDDDASVHPGFLHSKAMISYEQQGEYVTTKTFLAGRNSTQGGVPNDPSGPLSQNGLEGLKATFLGSVTWGNFDMKPVMAAALSHPGGCLNLPTPTEESHIATYEGFTDILSKGLHHATDRYDDLGPKIKSYLSYTQQTGLTDSLLKCGQKFYDSDILPWNKPNSEVMQKSDRTLKDVLEFAGRTATKKSMQNAYFENLAGFETSTSNQQLLTADYDAIFAPHLSAPNLEPTAKRELMEARDAYKGVQRDLKNAVEFKTQLVSKLLTDFDNVPGLNRDGNWTLARIGTDSEKISWLIANNHDIAAAVDSVRVDMQNNPPGIDSNSEQNPLTQIVFLTAKSVGAGQFNTVAATIAAI